MKFIVVIFYTCNKNKIYNIFRLYEIGGTVTLEECFDLYTRAETLGVEDAWHCPNCNRKQEVVKKLGLWSLPAILVIHLKRFRQQSKQRSTSKLTMLVDFPLYGFDMTPHLAHNGVQTTHQVSTRGGLNLSRLKKPRPNIPKYDENEYDLYAICNHHGQDLQVRF
jgi:ubiquitin carboxyl-terminal hydrolase 31